MTTGIACVYDLMSLFLTAFVQRGGHYNNLPAFVNNIVRGNKNVRQFSKLTNRITIVRLVISQDLFDNRYMKT